VEIRVQRLDRANAWRGWLTTNLPAPCDNELPVVVRDDGTVFTWVHLAGITLRVSCARTPENERFIASARELGYQIEWA
jgi:hypothetical protein